MSLNPKSQCAVRLLFSSVEDVEESADDKSEVDFRTVFDAQPVKVIANTSAIAAVTDL